MFKGEDGDHQFSNRFSSPVFRQTYRMRWIQELLQTHAAMHSPYIIPQILPDFTFVQELTKSILMNSGLYPGRMRHGKAPKCSKCLLRKEELGQLCSNHSGIGCLTSRVWCRDSCYNLSLRSLRPFNHLGCFAILDSLGVSWEETYNLALKT